MVTWRSPILSNPHDTEDRLDIVERCAKQVQQMAKAEKKRRTDTLQQPQNDPNWPLAAGIGSPPILWDIEVEVAQDDDLPQEKWWFYHPKRYWMFASLYQQNVVLESTQSSTPKKYNSNSSLKRFLMIRLMFSQKMVLEVAEMIFFPKELLFSTTNIMVSQQKMIGFLQASCLFPTTTGCVPPTVCVFLPKKLVFSPKMFLPPKNECFPNENQMYFFPKKAVAGCITTDV